MGLMLTCCNMPPVAISSFCHCWDAEHIQRAVKADKDGNIALAVEAYKQGLELLIEHLQQETDPMAKAGIAAKVENFVKFFFLFN